MIINQYLNPLVLMIELRQVEREDEPLHSLALRMVAYRSPPSGAQALRSDQPRQALEPILARGRRLGQTHPQGRQDR